MYICTLLLIEDNKYVITMCELQIKLCLVRKYWIANVIVIVTVTKEFF